MLAPPPLTHDQHRRRALLPPALWEETEDTLLQIMQDISTYLADAHHRRNPDAQFTATTFTSDLRTQDSRESGSLTRGGGVTSEARDLTPRASTPPQRRR